MKKTKTIPKLKAEAWSLYAKIVKLKTAINGNVKCYTCGSNMEYGTTNCQAGHYLSRGAYPGLTFHKDNSRPQCYRCNIHLHGNTVEFRHRLIDEIGLDRVVELEESRHIPVKLSRHDYLEMIEQFKEELSKIE